MNLFSSSNAASRSASVVSSSNNIEFKLTRQFLINYLLKIGGVTLIWSITGYCYLKAIDLIDYSDVIMIYAANFGLTYMASWVVLHNKFIPIKVHYAKSNKSLIFLIFFFNFSYLQ